MSFIARAHPSKPCRRFLVVPGFNSAVLTILAIVVGGYLLERGNHLQAQTPALPVSKTANAPMDAAVQLLTRACITYQGIRDYACVFVKREQVNGEQQPENVMAMKVRTQPFSVYLRWLAPKSLVGQEVCYVVGKNDGMMRAHSTGVLGAVGFISIDPRDPRALQTNRHPITDAGIGNLLNRLTQHYDVSRRDPATRVTIGDYEYNHRRCVRVELLHPSNQQGLYLGYRNVVYYDKETSLPIRCETYDWPRAGGPPAGELLSSYSYVDLHLNVNLVDGVFDH